MASGSGEVFTNDASQHWEMRRKASFSKLTGAVPRTIPGMFNVVEDPHADTKREKLWKLMETYLPSDVHSIQRSVVNHVVRAHLLCMADVLPTSNERLQP